MDEREELLPFDRKGINHFYESWKIYGKIRVVTAREEGFSPFCNCLVAPACLYNFISHT